MQSPGPPYQGPAVVSTDLYANRNYENHILSPHGVSNNYLTYHHSEESHSQNYSEQSHYSANSPTSHSSHGTPSPHHQYNSSNSGQTYGQPVTQFNDMYGTCSPYAATIPPAIRPPIPTSNLKYWNSDQMSHNSHNSYNQGIPPPPLVSRTQDLGSPTHRSPQCTTGNNYSAASVHHRSSSQSPQDWSRSPNVMPSPSTTPSPLPPHSSHNRSPSHVPSQQFSPSHTSHSGVSDSSQHQSVPKAQTGVPYNKQNHSSSHANASNPLQSLQKMVMIESESPDIRSAYDNMGPTAVQNNGTASLTANSAQKNYNNDQNLNNDPESPYPTYYNLDQNRLCTPPRPLRPNSNASDANIPGPRTDAFDTSDGQLGRSDSELKKSETNNNNNNNTTNDLIFSNIEEIKPELSVNSLKSNDSLNSSIVVNGDNAVNKMEASVVTGSTGDGSSNVLEMSSELPTVSAVCKRTASRDSVQSSDSETPHSAYGETRVPHNWQMEKEYFSRQSDNKNTWPQWPHNSSIQSSQPLPVRPPNSFLVDCRPVVPSQAPAPNPTSQSFQSSHSTTTTQLGSGSWAPSASSSQSSTPNRDFASPKNNMRQNCSKRKRGRPFGSKNRRNSDDTNSETNASDVSSPTKKRKKVVPTEEIGINTSVSIDAHGFDELAVVNPLKQVSKRKKTVGPFIRMERERRRNATLYSIVNASTKPEDEKDVKTKSHSNKSEPIQPIRRPSLLVSSKKVVSTLSPHYDLNTRDKTWVCALCHRGPHYKGLGDLYGPYYMNSEDKNKNQTTITSTAATTATTASASASASMVTTSSTRSISSRLDSIDETINSVVEHKSTEKKIRRRKSDNSDDTPKGRPKQQTLKTSEAETTHSTQSPTLPTEVWVHEDCIVWSNGVYLVGHRIRNLEEVITESNENVCTKCKLSGATLGCLQKSCSTSQFHYLCAKEKGCEMNCENFSLYCPKHKKKTKCNSDEPSACSSAKT